jgi:hypothetical protein
MIFIIEKWVNNKWNHLGHSNHSDSKQALISLINDNSLILDTVGNNWIIYKNSENIQFKIIQNGNRTI